MIIALGRWPLAPSQGYEGVVPGPATQDGLELAPANRLLVIAGGALIVARAGIVSDVFY